MTLRTGNVIKDPEGTLWIVSEVHDHGPTPTVELVSFDSENCSGVLRLDDHERTQTCFCGDDDYHQGEPDAECDDCKGTGRYVRKIKGLKHSKVLASCVKDFVLSGFKKAMRME